MSSQATTIRVGSGLSIGGKGYVVESIMVREHTYIAYIDSRGIKNTIIPNSIANIRVLDFKCEDFEVGDVITEKYESVQLRAIENHDPFTITKLHHYTKETYNVNNDHRTVDQTEHAEEGRPQAEDGGQGAEGESRAREQSAG
jgi:hypothetical protein